MRVLPGLCPPPPALVVPPLVRGGCGCCCDCFGFARRRRPVLRRGSRGRGVSCWGSLRLQAASLGRGLCALCYCLSRLAAAPCCRLGAKARPLHGRLAGCALLPCCRLGARRPAPLFPPAVLPAAACSRYAVTQPRCQTAPKRIKTAPKSVKKPAFCAAYRRKRPCMRQWTVR